MEVPERPEQTPEVQEEAQVAVEVPRARRRGRTALLIAAAAVLGVVAGTCTGYLVQVGRTPTPLPPLSQPVVKQAKGEVEPLSVAQDRRVRTDGDLRKLLLSRPSGARNALESDGWLDLAEYMHSFDKPAVAFQDLVDSEFRRVAVAAWETTDTHFVEIDLVQFHQGEVVGAQDHADNGMYWAERDSGNHSRLIPGTEEGMAYVDSTPEREPGYLPMYSAQAHAWRGDIAMDIYIYDTKPIPEKEIMSLAERQVGRL
ncbi:hypothetical protein ACWEQ1_31590 [Streptomyces nodosus]